MSRGRTGLHTSCSAQRNMPESGGGSVNSFNYLIERLRFQTHSNLQISEIVETLPIVRLSELSEQSLSTLPASTTQMSSQTTRTMWTTGLCTTLTMCPAMTISTVTRGDTRSTLTTTSNTRTRGETLGCGVLV